jgi:serine/threonine-protein kinase
MVLVAAGEFPFGPKAERVQLPAFYVDRIEVTKRAYAEFAKTTGANLPPGYEDNNLDLPVTNVTFDDAAAFAKWAGKRLPTSREWERAARGADGRKFPWGDSAELTMARTGLGRQGSLAPANGYAQGESPFHALQMVGNAWEWVDENSTPSAEMVEQFGRILTPPPAPDERWKMIRGGSYVEPLDPEVLSGFVSTPARYRSEIIGFRCVR